MWLGTSYQYSWQNVWSMAIGIIVTLCWTESRLMRSVEFKSTKHSGTINNLRRDRMGSAIVMLSDLHWLSMKKRVKCTLLPLVYTYYVHGRTPDYTTKRLNGYYPPGTLRSWEWCGPEATSAPTLWNWILLNLNVRKPLIFVRND